MSKHTRRRHRVITRGREERARIRAIQELERERRAQERERVRREESLLLDSRLGHGLRNSLALSEAQQEKLWIDLCTFLGGTPAVDVFRKEYQELKHNPRVESFRITSERDSLRLRVRTRKILVPASPMYSLYLGMYEVHLIVGRTEESKKRKLTRGDIELSLSVYCAETGRIDGSKTVSYPHGGEYGFCFGNRAGMMKNLLTLGELFGVFTLALDSFWHINKEDLDSLAALYNKYGIEECKECS